jgi:hypothetical protein
MVGCHYYSVSTYIYHFPVIFADFVFTWKRCLRIGRIGSRTGISGLWGWQL